ncbi:MAG: ABC transporter ATP-binding protein [Firmicutes bacterium]|nr:ABC transporter ATP-binding protein [Bacillota bacterium]
MIRVDSLTVNYGELRAVDNVSFTVSEGEIFGLVGPNGAGKTSTVECIEGLRRAYSGTVRVLGLDPWKDRQELYGLVGVQLQDTAYQERVRVFEICELFASLYRRPTPYDELLKMMQLTAKKRDFIANLSGGQRQKLSIVLALIPNPRVLFLDELTTGLDPHARHRMWELLLQLKKRGLTIVLVSHYMDEVEAVCDRVAMMNCGRIVSSGTIGEVVGRFALPTMISFRSPVEHLGSFENLAGITSVQRKHNLITLCGNGDKAVAALLRHLEENEIEYTGLAVKPPDLEAVFLELAGTAPAADSLEGVK